MSQKHLRTPNLTVNCDLSNQARSTGINLYAPFEKKLVDLVKTKQQQTWLTKNQQAIDFYNQQVHVNGTFGDTLREF